MSASPAPWAVSSEKGAYYIHPDRSPGVIAKVYRREDARLIRAAPELLEAVQALLSLAPEGGDLPDNGELSGAAICDFARAALRKSARGPP
ncbi:MAG: hypothetical protein QXT68_07345 [Halobacteria archaeon]